MALINSLNKLFPLICLLLFDKYINAFSTLLLIFLTSSILSGIISIIYLYFKNIKFKFQSILTIKNNLKIIFSFFWVFLLGKTRLIANKLVVGSFFSFELLAVFDIAEKIKNITLLPSQIIVDSNYSTQSKSFNTLLFKKTMLMVLISTITLILLSLAVIKNLFIFKDINKDFLFSILLAFSPLLILQSVNYHIQKSYLLSTSKLKLLNRVSIISSLSFFLILSFLLILNNVSIYCLIINNIMSALIASFFYIKYIINENILFK
jgi:O-antigen/teichoic acid export membrane protein